MELWSTAEDRVGLYTESYGCLQFCALHRWMHVSQPAISRPSSAVGNAFQEKQARALETCIPSAIMTDPPLLVRLRKVEADVARSPAAATCPRG